MKPKERVQVQMKRYQGQKQVSRAELKERGATHESTETLQGATRQRNHSGERVPWIWEKEWTYMVGDWQKIHGQFLDSKHQSLCWPRNSTPRVYSPQIKTGCSSKDLYTCSRQHSSLPKVEITQNAHPAINKQNVQQTALPIKEQSPHTCDKAHWTLKTC